MTPRESNLVNATHSLMCMLRQSGTTADWPVDLMTRDQASGHELAGRLMMAEKALEDYGIKVEREMPAA